MKSIVMVCAVLVALGATSRARAESLNYRFVQVTDRTSNPVDVAMQFYFRVSESSGGGIDFNLFNSEKIAQASSIDAIQFLGRSDFAPSSPTLLSDTALVDFLANTNATRLPGLPNDPFFGATSRSHSGLFPLGINSPQESLDVRFRLKDGIRFSNIVSALDEGSLRVAIRVRNITSPESTMRNITSPESTADFSAVFISELSESEPSVVPLPAVAPACMAMFGAGGLWCTRLRGRNKAMHSGASI